MTNRFTLAELGWAPDFLRQVELDELATFIPCRIAAVHRSRVEAFSERGALNPPAGLSAGEIAVGDWALSDGTTLLRLLNRRTCLARRAAGTGAARQLIAANIDTLFVVTSCNADFNPARLERYLALAKGAGVEPVILLTKADLAADLGPWCERAEAVDRRVAVRLLDARAPDAEGTLGEWCRPGQTVALAGSSGVGKTTLANALTNAAQATAPIREDAKGAAHDNLEAPDIRLWRGLADRHTGNARIAADRCRGGDRRGLRRHRPACPRLPVLLLHAPHRARLRGAGGGEGPAAQGKPPGPLEEAEARRSLQFGDIGRSPHSRSQLREDRAGRNAGQVATARKSLRAGERCLRKVDAARPCATDRRRSRNATAGAPSPATGARVQRALRERRSRVPRVLAPWLVVLRRSERPLFASSSDTRSSTSQSRSAGRSGRRKVEVND